jgi:hypothetical protein
LTSFYKSFIKDFSILVVSLIKIIKKLVLNEVLKKIIILKERISLGLVPLLASPEFIKTFEIECNFLGISIGVFLI